MNKQPADTPRPRSGTLQSQRGLRALSPDYFSVEERTEEDWLHYLKQFAQWLSFHTPSGSGGDWSGFFPEDDDLKALVAWAKGDETVTASVRELAARPDLALLLSFLRIMRHPMDQFRRLTERHLYYYYREVLGQGEKPAEPDQVHVLVQLTDSADPQVLPAGTLFDAGSDSEGLPRHYRLEEASGVNHAAIQTVRSLTLDRSGNHLGFLRTDLIDIDQEVEFPENGAQTFGELSLFDDSRQSYPNVGLLLGSNLLWLSEGLRTITLVFDSAFVDSEEFQQLTEDFHTYFMVSVSTAEGMVLLDDERLATVSSDIVDNRLRLNITLLALFPAVEPPAVSAHARLVTPYLQLNVKADDQHRLQSYEQLRRINLNSLTLETEVEGLTQLVLRNDSSTLDPSGPMELFGSQPRTGSRLQFTHPELAIKPLESLQLNVSWSGRPEDMASWYQPYKDYFQAESGSESIDWPVHTVAFESRYAQSEMSGLFDAPLLRTTTEDGQFNSLGNLYPDGLEWPTFSELSLSQSDARDWPFWYSLKLTGDDFGHHVYSNVASYHNSQYIQQVQQNPGSAVQPVTVKQPWTPLADSISVDYKAVQTITVTEAGIGASHQLLHVHPVGYQAVVDAEQQTLLPALEDSGYLYIGLSRPPQGGSINLLLQLAPVDANPALATALVKWSYLAENRWLPFATNNQNEGIERALILADNTNDLIDSGIIRFGMDDAMTRETGFPGDNQLWLRASLGNIDNGPASWSRLLGVHTQALNVRFDDSDNVPRHLPATLPGETIGAIMEGSVPIEVFSAVDSVSQPYATFGGRAEEQPENFASRISERLRHRGRALTLWDYEHLVLEKFPDIVLAHCLRNPLKPYGIRLLVVPRVEDPAILKPRVQRNVQQQIHDYLRPLMPPVACLEVGSPLFQEVRFEVSLIFDPNYDPGLVLQTLNSELIALLNPWIDKPGAGSADQNGLNPDIHVSDIIAFIEQQPYVDLVMKVAAAIAEPDDSGNVLWVPVAGQVVKPARDDIILVPAARHSIRALPSGSTVYEGISLMEVEFDFFVAADDYA